MEPSIFTKIINREIPAHIVYEDDKVIAFMEIDPITIGHTLVIPKKQVIELLDLEDDLYQAVMAVVKQVAHKQKQVYQPTRVGTIVAGFDVPHAHVHVFPLFHELTPTLKEKWARTTNPSNEELAHEAERIRL